MEIWCLAPYLPGVQAVSAHKDPQHCFYSGVCLCQVPQPSEESRCSMPAWLNLTEETSTWQWIKLWTQGCLLLIQHGTLHHWGGQTTKRPDHLWTTRGIQLASFWQPLHLMELFTLNCMSFCHWHWLSSNSVEKKGLKDLALTVFTLRLLKYIARYIPHIKFKSFSLYLCNISSIQKVIDLRVPWKVYFFLYLSHFWKRNRML